MKTILTIFTIILFVSGNAWGATYHVNHDGSVGANGEDCDHAYSLSWFNSNGNGDTAVLCDDNYTLTYIYPTNDNNTYIADNACTGSPGSYSGAVFDGTSYGAYIDSASGTTIDGICFESTESQWIRVEGSNTVTIQNNHFYEAVSSYSGILVAYSDSLTDLSILNNVFEDGEPSDSGGGYNQDNIQIHKVDRALIQGNTFGNARHSNIGVGTRQPDHIVVRNNTFVNEWHAAVEGRGSYWLVENNTMADGSVGGNPYSDPKDNTGIYVTSIDHAIVRKNKVWNEEYGMLLGYTFTWDSEYNYIYNNTFYNNWRNVPITNNSNATHYWANHYVKNNIFSIDSPTTPTTLDTSTCFYDATVDAGSAVHLVSCANHSSQSSYYDTNVFEYNLFQGQTDYFYWPNTSSSQQSLASLESSYSYWANNVNGDPVFTDESNDDFTLQATSDAIDAGSGLTTITSSTGSGTQFTVDDAGYFYDGWNISGETGDVIKTQNGETCTIQSISGNTITCNPSISWTQGEWVALDYEGSAPDIGAEEYQQTGIIMTITATDSSGAEEVAGSTDTVEFTLACSPDCNATAVNYSFSGGAVLDTDYNCDDEDGTITITGSSDTITCTPIDDSEQEITETITVTVDSGTGYTVGSPSQASATITDNDGAQDQGIAGITVDGSGSGQITYDQSGTGRWTRGDYGVEYQ